MNTAELINGDSLERGYQRASNHLYSAFYFVIVLSILIIELNVKKKWLETAVYSNVFHLQKPYVAEFQKPTELML